MRKIDSVLLYLSAFLLTTAALAQPAQRTFVSAGSGTDSNPCSRQLPCRNFAAAIAQTAYGGEVIVLDSGGYGPLSITSSISLISPVGVYAGITEFSDTAISVAIPASDEVTLRGLYLQGLGGGYGISFSSGGSLSVENCTISNFIGFGIFVAHTAGGGRLIVADTVVRNLLDGITIGTTSGVVHAVLDHVRIESTNNADGYGFHLAGGSRVLIVNSIAAYHRRQVYATNVAVVDIERSQFFGTLGTSVGVSTAATPGTIIRISNSVIANNGTGILQGTGTTITSLGDNRVESNTVGNTFPSTLPPK
jgi:hypothetical protein